MNDLTGIVVERHPPETLSMAFGAHAMINVWLWRRLQLESLYKGIAPNFPSIGTQASLFEGEKEKDREAQ